MSIAETVPGFVTIGWIGYFAPAGTQPSIINQFSKAPAAICREPDIDTTAPLGVDTAGTSRRVCGCNQCRSPDRQFAGRGRRPPEKIA
jgi:hypothetical protein